jgi:signal transduction histidine kinase
MKIFNGRVKKILFFCFVFTIGFEAAAVFYFSKSYEALLSNNYPVSPESSDQNGELALINNLWERYNGLAVNVENYNRKVTAGFIFFSIFTFTLACLFTALFFLNEIAQEKAEQNHKKELAQRDDVIRHYARLSSVVQIPRDIVHQWKQPLNNLKMIVSNMRDSVSEEDYDQLGGLSDDANKVIRLFSDTIDDFNNLFVSESEDSIFDIKDILDYVVLLFRGVINENGIQCNVEYDGNLRIYGKKSRLTQVFNNMMDNSIYAIKENNTQKGIISIVCRENDRDISVTFRDNGGGIPREILDHVFSAYFTSKGSKGSGLGLSICREIISQFFGGSMEFRNMENGAEFIVSIPKFGGEGYGQG